MPKALFTAALVFALVSAFLFVAAYIKFLREMADADQLAQEFLVHGDAPEETTLKSAGDKVFYMLKIRLDEASKERDDARFAMDGISKDKTALERTISDLESQILQVQEQTIEFAGKETELLDLKKSSAEIEQQRLVLSRSVEKLEADKKTQMSDMQTLTTQRDELKAEFEVKSAEVSVLSTEIGSLKQSLEKEETQQASVVAEMGGLAKEKTGLEQRVDELEGQISIAQDLTDAFAKKEAELLALKKSSAEIEQQRLALSRSVEKLEANKKTQMSDMQTLTTQRDELKAEFEVKSAEVSVLSAEIASLKQSLEKEETQQASVVAEMGGLAKEKTGLEQRVDELEGQISIAQDLTDAFTKKEAELLVLKKSSAEIERQQSELSQKINQTEEEKEVLLANLQTLTAERDDLKSGFAAKAQEISDLTTQITSLNQALAHEESKKAMAIYGQSVKNETIRSLEMRLEHMALERDNSRNSVSKLEAQQANLVGEIEALYGEIEKYSSFQSVIDEKATMIPSGGLFLKRKGEVFGFSYENDQDLDVKYSIRFTTEAAGEARLRDRPEQRTKGRIFIPFSDEMRNLVKAGEAISFEFKMYNVANEDNPASWHGKFKLDISTNKLVWLGP